MFGSQIGRVGPPSRCGCGVSESITLDPGFAPGQQMLQEPPLEADRNDVARRAGIPLQTKVSHISETVNRRFPPENLYRSRTLSLKRLSFYGNSILSLFARERLLSGWFREHSLQSGIGVSVRGSLGPGFVPVSDKRGQKCLYVINWPGVSLTEHGGNEKWLISPANDRLDGKIAHVNDTHLSEMKETAGKLKGN